MDGVASASCFEYQVSRNGGGLTVRAVDRFDGEKAEVYDVNWDGEALTFFNALATGKSRSSVRLVVRQKLHCPAPEKRGD